jgi:hypothetical protein
MVSHTRSPDDLLLPERPAVQQSKVAEMPTRRKGRFIPTLIYNDKCLNGLQQGDAFGAEGPPWPQPFLPNDYGVEIGGRSSFENLPRSIRRANEKTVRKVCVGCRRHRALFRYRGRVRFDRQHDLCGRCFRSAIDRLQAGQLTKANIGRR